MNFKVKYFLILIVSCITISNVFAAKRYWISAATSTWNTTANWSATSGGAGGSSVPGSSDTAYFDGGGLGRCDIDANVNVKRFEMQSAYTDTVTQNAYTITVGTGGMIVNGGVFTGSSSAITINNGNYNNGGCSFTSTSGTLDIRRGDFKLTGTGSFFHNNGTVLFFCNVSGSVTDTCNIDISTSSANKTVYNLSISSNANNNFRLIFGTGNVLTVENNINFAGAGYILFYNGGIIEAKKNVTVSMSGLGSFEGQNSSVAGLLKFIGSSPQVLTGNATTIENLPRIEIAKTGDTLTLAGTFGVKYNWTLTSGNLNSGTSKISFISNGQTLTFAGVFNKANALNKISFIGTGQITFVVNDTVFVKDSIKLSVNTYFNMGTNAGVIAALGTVYIPTNGFFNANSTGTLLMCGTGTQRLRSDYGRSSTTYPLAHFVIKKSSGDTLILSGFIKTSRNWTYTSGIVNSDNAIVYFLNRNNGIIGSHTLKKAVFDYGNNSMSISINSAHELTVTDSLWFSGDGFGSLSTGTINAKGAIVLNNTSTTPGYINLPVGTGLIRINGTGDQTITGAASESTMYLPNFEINKTAGTLYLNNFIYTGGNWTHTNGTVVAGTSTVMFSRTNVISGSPSLFNVIFNGVIGGQAVTIASGTTLSCMGSLTYKGTFSTSVNTGTIEAQGDINLTNTGTGGGTATILVNGTGVQSINSSVSSGQCRLPKVTINKTNSLNLSGEISVTGNWTYISGDVSVGISTVAILATCTISGKQSFYGLKFEPASAGTFTLNSADTLTVTGPLTLQGTQQITINSGIIQAKGDISVTNTSTSASAGGTATILINGTANQTLTGSGTSGTGFLPKISINKSTGTLTLASTISCNQEWVYVAGSVNPGTSLVWFRGAFNLDGQGTTGTMRFNNVSFGGSSSRTLTGNLTVAGNIAIGTSCTLNNSGNYAISLGGNWTNNGTFTAGTGTLKIDGAGYQSINKASAALETFPNVTMVKTGGSLTLNCPVKVTTNFNLIEGIIKSSSTNYFELSDNITMPDKGSDTGYVCGPVRKTGNDAFTFPLGDTVLTSGAYHPLEITAPSSATDQFEARYYATGQTLGNTLDDSLENLSSCEYWSLNETVGTSTVTPTISWNSNWCNENKDYEELRVAKWNSTTSKWDNFGNSAYNVLGTDHGTLKAANGVSSGISYLTTSSVQSKKTWAMLAYKPGSAYYQVEGKYVRLKYIEEYMDSDNIVDINIYRLIDNKQVYLYNNSSHMIALGDNRIRIDTDDLVGGGISGFYLLEIINEKKEKLYLKFKI